MGLSWPIPISATLKFGESGIETDLAYLAGLVALALGGDSALSVDRWIRRRAAQTSPKQPDPNNWPPRAWSVWFAQQTLRRAGCWNALAFCRNVRSS